MPGTQSKELGFPHRYLARLSEGLRNGLKSRKEGDAQGRMFWQPASLSIEGHQRNLLYSWFSFTLLLILLLLWTLQGWIWGCLEL